MKGFCRLFVYVCCLSMLVSCISGSAVQNLPAVRETKETQVQSLGHEDLLETGMTTHSTTLARRIPWTEEPGRRWSGRKEADMTEATGLAST